MKPERLRIVFLGLSVTSSWGNGHATTYRGLMRGLAARNHEILFLERDKPWYAANRDLPSLAYARVELYQSLEDLEARFAGEVRRADLVVVGSYVPEGVLVAEWVLATARGATAFYDIDTPITLAKLGRGDTEYLSPELIPRFNLYLSFTGGPTLRVLEKCYGARRARVLYCCVDPILYYPESQPRRWDLGYVGTYSEDRQAGLDRLLLEPARRSPLATFVVAGPLYPPGIAWPANVERIEHLPPFEHRRFYNSQRFTLNLTRGDMVRAGYSPSVRLFEASACGTPIVSDSWPGLEEILEPGREILLAGSTEDALHLIAELPEKDRVRIGEGARKRVMAEHTAAHRAGQLERYACEVLGSGSAAREELAPRPLRPARVRL